MGNIEEKNLGRGGMYVYLRHYTKTQVQSVILMLLKGHGIAYRIYICLRYMGKHIFYKTTNKNFILLVLCLDLHRPLQTFYISSHTKLS